MIALGRVAFPLFDDCAEVLAPASVKDLTFEACPKQHAVRLVKEWHSRLPFCQSGPWEFAFHGHHHGVTYVVALWNTPSARMLPGHWLELRRMASAPDAPRNTCSAFLGWMHRHFSRQHPERERLISYQDTGVHTGTIYRAAGWTPAHESKPRVRDRSGPRVGTSRLYRSNINGVEPDASAKVRWEKALKAPRVRTAHESR